MPITRFESFTAEASVGRQKMAFTHCIFMHCDKWFHIGLVLVVFSSLSFGESLIGSWGRGGMD